jgi:putative DNA primase/helicase
MALARLGEFSRAQQSRPIVIWMLPKLVEEKRERLWPVIVPELVQCRRQLAAWAATVAAWIVPTVREYLYNRGAENWEPLLFVAERAGEGWRERARAAAEVLSKVEQRPSLTARLLKSIWKAYQPDPEKPPKPFLATEFLRTALTADADEDWAREGPGGRGVTSAWLRERLRHLLNPEGSQRESAFGPRGYAFRQFEGAFARYIGPQLPEEPIIDASIDTFIGSPDSSGSSVKELRKTAKKSKPDGSAAYGLRATC